MSGVYDTATYSGEGKQEEHEGVRRIPSEGALPVDDAGLDKVWLML